MELSERKTPIAEHSSKTEKPTNKASYKLEKPTIKSVITGTYIASLDIGLCIQFSMATYLKLIDVGVRRVTDCTCPVCEKHDAYYGSKAITFRLSKNSDKVKMVVCQQGLAYELYQTVYKLPEGTILVDTYKAEKQRVFKPNKLIFTFKADKAKKEHVKKIHIESKSLKPWEPVTFNGQKVNRDGSFSAADAGKLALGITTLALGIVLGG